MSWITPLILPAFGDRRVGQAGIRAQNLWLCEHSRTLYQSAVTTGATAIKFRATPTGTYRIEGRNRNSVLRPNDGRAYPVKYWVPFDAPNYGFHDSSWQEFPYGSPRYRSDGSHGCVHLPLAGMKFLYRWVHIGARVVIRA